MIILYTTRLAAGVLFTLTLEQGGQSSISIQQPLSSCLRPMLNNFPRTYLRTLDIADQ